MNSARTWYCCARINRADKGYFANQIDGFEKLDPLVVTWEDGRPASERGGGMVISQPWNKSLPIRGGYRLNRAMLHARSLLAPNPFATSGAEKASLMELARRSPPERLYCHTGFVALRMMPIAEAFDVPLVTHFHGLDINIRDDLHQRVLSRYLHQIHRVVVVARWMIPWFVSHGYNPDRIIVSPMGVPLKREADLSDALAMPPYFVFVGRFVRYKGIDRTIKAFAAVNAEYPNARLKIVGDGPLGRELRAQVSALGLQEVVDFTGPLTAEKTLQTISESCALVHHAMDEPDGPEAFPTVVSEAMALGKPVIGTRCGGIPDQVVHEETGYLVDQNDVEAMARYMTQLLQDDALGTRLGQAGRRRAEAELDSVRLARRIESMLQTL